MIGYIVIASFVIMLASLSGKLVTFGVVGHWVGNNLRYLTSFALGVFVVTFSLMVHETVELQVSLGAALLCAALGAVALEVLQRFIPDAHHHHGVDEDDCCDTEHGHAHTINPRRVLLGDAAHNIGDGILLASAFMVNFWVGVTAFLGILMHEMVQEVSEFFLLKHAGYSTVRALWSNFVVSGSILVGVALTLVVAQAEGYVPYLIAFSAGATLYIITVDLLPHVVSMARKHGEALKHILIVVIGALVLFGVTQIFPHEHEEGATHQEIPQGERV